MNGKQLIYGFIIAGFAAAALLSLMSKNVPAYGSTDPAAYIEAAHNLRAGKGLTVSAFGIYPLDQDMEQLREWPPGYPLLIALVSSFNIDEKAAAMIIPRFFFLLLPLAFFLVLRFFLNDTLAFASAIIITFMWPTVALSMMALSDIPFLFLCLISFYLLFKTIADDRLSYGFAAGISTALAVMVRYIGYNLLFGVIIGLLLGFFMRTIPREKYLRIQAGYFCGFVLVYLPMLLRNIFTFHTLQPYRMPFTPVSWSAPGIKYLKEMACIFVGIWPSHGIYLVGLILLLLAAAYYLKRGFIIRYYLETPAKTTYIFILLSYFSVAVLLFAVIGPRYIWHNDTEFRVFIPHCWIIAAFLISAMVFCCERLEHFFKIQQKWPIAILLIIFFLAQFSALQVWIGRQRPQYDTFVNLENSAGLISAIKSLPGNAYIISNCGPYLRLLTGRDVRKLSRLNINFPPQGLADLVCRTRPLYVILVYGPGVSGILPPSWLSIGKSTLPAGYRCVSCSGTTIILYHEREV